MNECEQLEVSPFGNKSVLSPEQTFEDQQLGATSYRKSFLVNTMAVWPDQTGEKLFDIFASVPDGSKKQLFYDGYTEMVIDSKVIAWELMCGRIERAETLTKRLKDYFKRLEGIGVDLKELNPPRSYKEFMNPTKGRCHIKGTVGEGATIDDWVAYIEGFNRVDVNTNIADCAVKFTGEIAAKIARVLQLYNAGEIKENSDYVLEEGTTLFVEIGDGTSPILDMAAQIFSEAQASIKHTSLLKPDGIIAKILSETYKKDKRVEVIMGQSKLKPQFPPEMDTNMLWLANTLTSARERFVTYGRGYDYPIIFNKNRLVHGKLTLIDDKAAIFGSHNLSTRGVNSKTAEWAIYTRDRELVNNLRAKYNEFYKEAFRSHYL